MVQVTARSIEKYQVLIDTGEHALLSDEPKDIGDGLGADPYELLLSALSSCTVMTLLMYARRKGWPLEGVRAELSFERIHAEDCEECEEDAGMLEMIEVKLSLIGDLSDEQRSRLLEVADRCPVRKTLGSGPKVRHQLIEM